MPTDKLPVIFGIKDPKELARFQNMLKAVGVPDEVKQIYVSTPSELQHAQNVFGITGGTHEHPAFSLYSVGRIYLPQEAIGNDNLISKYLLHEFGHFAAGAYNRSGAQSDMTEDQSMALESAADKAAKEYRDKFKLYNSPQGKAYQSEQAQVASDAGRIQPTPVSIQTALNSPLVIGHEGSSEPQPTPAVSIGPRIQP